MLRLTHITKKYVDDRNEPVIALDDVNLVFPDTGLVVVTGTSGCGKTTLLNILGGLDCPTAGEVWFDHIRIDDKDESWWDSFRSSSLGFVYQDFNLLENMTVRDNIRLPLALQKLDEQTTADRINRIIEELGLSEYLDKRAGKLSGGQKQRTAIARALVTAPRIILADEPTGNLDKENSEAVFQLLKKAAKERLIIVVTHDISLAQTYADRLIHIAYGSIECDTEVAGESDHSSREIYGEETGSVHENSAGAVEKRKLSRKDCLSFAKEAMKRRKLRCLISVLIFSITMLLTLIASEVVFRDDSIPVIKYINDNHYNVLPLFTEVSEEYTELTENNKITSGKIFYDFICQCADESRIIRCGRGQNLRLDEEGSIEVGSAYVSADNKTYFTFEGKFPEKADEIAVSGEIAENFPDKDIIPGSSVFINEKKYTITAIVTEVCGRSMEEIRVDDGYGFNLFENVIFFSADALIDKTGSSGIYMPGFGVTAFANMFYQTTVYNEIRSVEDELQLISGRMPEKNNEILISQSLLDLRNQTDRDVIGQVHRMNDLHDEIYGRSYWNMVNLYDYMGESMTVVGVAQGGGDYYVTASLYEKIYEEYKTYCELPYLLLGDGKQLKDDIHKLMENGVRINDSNLERAYDIADSISYAKNGIIILISVIALLAVLQMISLYSYSINDHKKTIGVLRTLGVNKSDTKKIFTVECMVVTLLAFVIAIISNIFLTNALNGFINQNMIQLDGFYFLHMRFIVILVTGAVSVLLSFFSVVIPLGKYSKRKIIELIQ